MQYNLAQVARNDARCRLARAPARGTPHEEIILKFEFRWPIAIAAVLALALLAGVALAATGAQFVQVRRGLFGEMSGALKHAADRWQDPTAYGEVAQSARVIQRDARDLLKLFPKGDVGQRRIAHRGPRFHMERAARGSTASPISWPTRPAG